MTTTQHNAANPIQPAASREAGSIKNPASGVCTADGAAPGIPALATGPRARSLNVACLPLSSLEQEWRQIAPVASTRNVFVDWEFQSTWWRHFGRSKVGRVFVVRGTRGELLGIVPLYIDNVKLRLGSARILRNVGYGAPVNPDHLDALVVPGAETAVATAVARQLAADPGWDFADWSELAEDAFLVRVAHAIEREHFAFVSIEPRSICPYIRFEGKFSDYLAGCGSHFRYRVRNAMRKVDKSLGVAWRRIGSDIDPQCGMKLLAQLHQERMTSSGRGGNFLRRSYEAFHLDLARRLARSGHLYSWVIFSEGLPLAGNYGFLHEGRYYGYQMGFAPRFQRWSPGTYMIAETARRLVDEEGGCEMDLLRGGDSWKSRWTQSSRRTLRVNVVRPTWRSRSAHVRAGLSGSPALVLRYLIGRDSFDSLRKSWKKAAEQARGIAQD